VILQCRDYHQPPQENFVLTRINAFSAPYSICDRLKPRPGQKGFMNRWVSGSEEKALHHLSRHQAAIANIRRDLTVDSAL